MREDKIDTISFIIIEVYFGTVLARLFSADMQREHTSGNREISKDTVNYIKFRNDFDPVLKHARNKQKEKYYYE